MSLLDCGFCFFTNFPCRLSTSEMKFDLPCDESLFAARHPFMEPNFTASRRLTTYEAFQSLFGYHESPAPQKDREDNGIKSNPLNLNAMDMFILIHRVYSCILLLLLKLTVSSSLCLYPHTHHPVCILPWPFSKSVWHIISLRRRKTIHRL